MRASFAVGIRTAGVSNSGVVVYGHWGSPLIGFPNQHQWPLSHPGRNAPAFPHCSDSFRLHIILLDSPPAAELTSVDLPPVSRDREPATWLTLGPAQAAWLVALKKPSMRKRSHNDPVQVCSRLFCRCSGVSGIQFVIARTGTRPATAAHGLRR